MNKVRSYSDCPTLQESLSNNLRELMQHKEISEAELSRKIGIPQATLHKIITGKTEDPRTSTLKLLADYFNISMDELISDALTMQGRHQTMLATQSIPIISWTECLQNKKIISEIDPSHWKHWIVSEPVSKSAYALMSKPSMEPRFPRGTVLIINPELQPEDDDIVVAQYPNTSEATLRKLIMDGPKKILTSLTSNTDHDKLNHDIKLLGVLVKSTFFYHTS